MINFNENILEDNTLLSINNRGFAYGDALFETIKASYGKLLFWEDHYFRLNGFYANYAHGDSNEFYHGIFGGANTKNLRRKTIYQMHLLE